MILSYFAKRKLEVERTMLKAIQVNIECNIYKLKSRKADIKAQLAYNEQILKEGILTEDQIEDYEVQSQEGKSLFKALSKAEKDMQKTKKDLEKEIVVEGLLDE